METSITINNLSQSEIELIAKSRELELQKQKEINDAIAAKRESAKNELEKKAKKLDEQVEAARKYYEQFDSNLYELKVREYTITKDIYGLNFDDGVIDTIEKLVYEAHIVRIGLNDKIGIEEHFVYSSRWDSRGTNNGFKLTLKDDNYNTKYYKKAETVITKIEEKIESIKREKESKLNKQNAIELNIKLLKDKYKDAKIEASKEYKTMGRDYITIDVINVYLANGIKVVNRIWENGKMSIYDVQYPIIASTDVTIVMDKLNSMSF